VEKKLAFELFLEIQQSTSFVLRIHFKKYIFVISGARLARSIIDNKYCVGEDSIFRQIVDVWTPRGHQGCLITAS
jgi:hypothetical protein